MSRERPLFAVRRRPNLDFFPGDGRRGLRVRLASQGIRESLSPCGVEVLRRFFLFGPVTFGLPTLLPVLTGRVYITFNPITGRCLIARWGRGRELTPTPAIQQVALTRSKCRTLLEEESNALSLGLVPKLSCPGVVHFPESRSKFAAHNDPLKARQV